MTAIQAPPGVDGNIAVVVFSDDDAVPCAIVDAAGNVVNMVHANPATYRAPLDHILVVAGDNAAIGGRWDGVAFICPPAPERIVVANDIKSEARRRILARYPEWKQANMTAQGVELLNIRLSVGSWTPTQAQEAADLGAAWDWIKAVRAASDQIEAMSPIPADYQSDAHWPI